MKPFLFFSCGTCASWTLAFISFGGFSKTLFTSNVMPIYCFRMPVWLVIIAQARLELLDFNFMATISNNSWKWTYVFEAIFCSFTLLIFVFWDRLNCLSSKLWIDMQVYRIIASQLHPNGAIVCTQFVLGMRTNCTQYHWLHASMENIIIATRNAHRICELFPKYIVS